MILNKLQESKFNDLVSSKIKEKIPRKQYRVTWLMDTLKMSKESIYRRLKGVIPFQFEEVCILAQKLDFSIDEMVFGCANGLINNPNSRYENNGNANPMIALLQRYSITLKKMEEISGSGLAITANRLNLFMALEYDNLFNLLMLKQLHKTCQSIVCPEFSKMYVPENIQILWMCLITGDFQLDGVQCGLIESRSLF